MSAGLAGAAPAPAAPRPLIRPGVAVARLPLLGLGGLALLAGLWSALLLLGVHLPWAPDRLPEEHGALMSLGFLGTLIALERAVALGAGWAYLSPLASGLGALVLVAGAPPAVGRLLVAAGGVGLVVVYLTLLRRQLAEYLLVQLAGAASWYLACLLWLAGRPVPEFVPQLAGFLVLTIAGERLELARVGLLSARVKRLFLAASGLLAAGVVVAAANAEVGWRLTGAGLLALAGWLGRYDVARRTVRLPGLPRFVAVSLLAGYAWLGAAGVLWLLGPAQDGWRYDALLHAIFLGFVISMVIAHAPVILPAVLRVRPRFGWWQWPAPALLQAGLLLRVLGGDARGDATLWQLGGVLNVVAVLGFVGVTIAAATCPARASGR